MDDIYDIIVNEKITEEYEVFDLLEKEVIKINEKTESITFLLKHSRILFMLSFIFFFLGLPKFIYFGTLFFWFMVFLTASSKNSERTILKNRFQNLVIFFEVKGLINKDNKHLLVRFKLRRLWFENDK